MTDREYLLYKQAMLQKADDIEAAKRPAYTGDSPNVLANFENAGKRAGISREQAWLVHFLKHIDAITSWAKNPDTLQAEPIIGRFADAVNYLKIGAAMAQENEELDIVDVDFQQVEIA